MDKEFLDYAGLQSYDALIKIFMESLINRAIFVGTKAEYETALANGEIAIGCLVCITDDEPGSSGSSGSNGENSASTTAILGQAILGQMILG